MRFVVYSCGAIPVSQSPAGTELIYPPLLIYLTGEELDRATEVLSNLKSREERKIFTPKTAFPYEFLRKLDKETLLTSHRQNTNTPAFFQKQEQQWWNEKSALLSLMPPKQLLLEQSEYSTASTEDLSLQDKDFKHGQRLLNCLSVRLLKMDKIEPNSCGEIVNSSIRLLHCPDVFKQDSTSSIASSYSLLLTPPPALPTLNMVPSGDLAAVVSKLRQMTASVAKLQSTLGKFLEAKKVQQQMQQQQKGNEHEKFNIRLTRF